MVVLGVEESVRRMRWVLDSTSDKMVNYFIQKYEFPEILARILVARGLDEQTIDSFLSPTLKDNLPDPYILKDAQKVAARIADSIERGEKIGIMGDYDVDGATSSALLKLFLKTIGVPVRVFIPDRDDGYGPNAEQMQKFYDDGIRLIATVDCGMTAFEPIDFGTKLGMDIVIIDHHEPEKVLPNAYGVVNPKRLDEDKNNPCHFMAAVGVVFLVVVAINRILRERGFYQTHKEPDLKEWLDLVAFGTICDVVPLSGVNRLFVKSGLKKIHQQHNLGLKTLSEVAQVSQRIDSYHLGYILGPRINAGGRVGKSALGMQLLSTSDDVEARQIAEELEDLNILRRSIEAEVLEQATEQAEESIRKGLPYLLVKGVDWHQGVVGIVAGRLKERYNLPTFVLSIDKEGDDVKGSSRSVVGVDLGALVIKATQEGILYRGGGHPMAAGFSLRRDKLDDFDAFLSRMIKEKSEEEKMVCPDYPISGVIDLSAATPDLLDKISVLEPYGEGNPEPRFALKNVMISKTILTKNGHIICKLTNMGGATLDAISFRAQETEIGKQLLLPQRGKSYHMAGFLRLDTWNGKNKVQLLIDDIALAS